MNYLDSITLTKSLPCLAEPGRIIVIGKPSQILGEVLPYLATLPGIIAWNPQALTLTFRRPHGFMTRFTSHKWWIRMKDWNCLPRSRMPSMPCGKNALNYWLLPRPETHRATWTSGAYYHRQIAVNAVNLPVLHLL
jgi:hypothetical protein